MTTFRQIGIEDRLLIFSNGKDIVDFVDTLFRDIEEGRSDALIQPVSLILLDIHMPILSGIDAFKRISHKYQNQNEQTSLTGSIMVKPLICYLS